MNDEVILYLLQILQKYQARDLSKHIDAIAQLKATLQKWAGGCFLEIKISGSRAKGTAISLASDVDFMVSLKSGCNENRGGLKSIHTSLYAKLVQEYRFVRKQNVSLRINLSGIEVDITPARKQVGNTNNHNLYVSKFDTWKQTNIQKHIVDIQRSGRTPEIKLIKIWRELNKLEFPSVYLEYLIIDTILLNKPKDVANLKNNIIHIFTELARNVGNPLNARVIDPANTGNVLSDLLNQKEKAIIISAAKRSLEQQWNQVFF